MQNQIHIGTVDRRKIVRILIDHIPASSVIDMSPGEVTDEMIADEIHPRQKLDIGLLFGRPIHVTERDKILDMRQYLENVGPFPDRVMRKIGEQVRELTGTSLM